MSSNTGLSVSDAVNIAISLSNTPSALRNFGATLVLGDSGVIDVYERIREYSGLNGVGADFGDQAPEYLAAQDFFQQNPEPSLLYVGAWASEAVSGRLTGGVLPTAAQNIANWISISNGGMNITVDGNLHALTGLNFTLCTNLNGVAANVQTALGASATVEWDAANNVFRVTSASTGVNSQVSFASSGAGTDVSAPMMLQQANGGYSAGGMAAETLAQGVLALALESNDWYMLQVASNVTPADSDYQAVSAFINGTSPVRVFGVTTQESGALVAATNTDLAALLQAGNTGRRTYCQYSSSDPFASAAALGVAATVDFLGNNTTITLNGQDEGGLQPETLSETQANALIGKNCNVFVEYNNDTAILQPGCMSDGTWFDVVQGTDWLQNYLQNLVWNFMYGSRNKVPQTDPGVNSIIGQLTQGLEQARTNGLVAPGVWNGGTIGNLSNGQMLTKGYYIYAPSVNTQSEATRLTRVTPLIQIAVKLSGAFHKVSVAVAVNQ